jgi:phosphoglycolate phosphatase
MIKHIVFDHDGTLVNMQEGRRLFPGIQELLTELSDKGIKLYVWTARDRYSCIKILKSLDIIGIFEDISTATDCEPKPNPQGLKDMLEGVDASEVAMIGDSFTDMIGANNYGALAVGAIWDNPTLRVREVLAKMGAKHICATVEDCKKLLLKNI